MNTIKSPHTWKLELDDDDVFIVFILISFYLLYITNILLCF